MLKYKKLIIGVDQSYTKTGISLAVDNKLVVVTSIAFKDCKSKSDKRKALARVLNRILKLNCQKASESLVICERIRTFSFGGNNQGKNKSFMNINYIKTTGALISTIVDTSVNYNIPVYSVDTRSWKAQILGSSKNKQGDSQKQSAIDFVDKLGFNVGYKNSKGVQKYDDDAADSACIALYGFIPKSKQKLKLEE